MANQITAFLDPTQLPARTQDQATFDAFMALFMQYLPSFGSQANALAANLNTISAGGAHAVPYKYVASTGPIGTTTGGCLSFDNSLNAQTTTRLWVDHKSSVGDSYDALYTAETASTSAIRGYVRLVKQSDATHWAIFALTSYNRVDATYGMWYVTPVAQSFASPFTANDAVLMYFSRNGDAAVNSVIYVRDEKASGTGGGTQANLTWVAATLNTVKVNTISGASLSSNQVTLPAGVYEYVGSVPGYQVERFQSRLYNASDSTVIDVGTSERAWISDATTSKSWVRGQFTLAASKAVALQRWVYQIGDASNSLGYPASTGSVEVYGELFIKKVV